MGKAITTIIGKKWAVFVVLIILAGVNSYIFGLSRPQGWGDASEYSAYAKNLVTLGKYSLDGINFSSFREPGYPLILFLSYSLFGIETPLSFLAVKISQILMLSVAGYLAFKIFADFYGRKTLGVIAGAIVVLIPYYGYYAGDISTEMPFAFFLILSFYLILKTVKSNVRVLDFIFLGLALAGATLIRAQLLFFPFLLLISALILRKEIGKEKLKKFFISILVFLAMVGGWAGVVFSKTGHFNISSGRQYYVIYYRAVRSELSYAGLSRYLKEWVKRSATGGQTSEFLDNNEFKKLNEKYSALQTENENWEKELQVKNIKTIIRNFDKYLVGNAVELVKLTFVEHTYAGDFNKYGRAAFYILLYAFFVNGLVQFLFYRQKLFRTVFWLSLIFIIYNVLIMTAIDAIPRYNTPYLFFYLVIGVLGVWTTNQSKINQK